MTVTPPQAVIFDWDGTLVDSWPAIHEALNATFAAFGLEPWTYEQTLARVRKSMRESFPALFGDEWERAGEVFNTHVAEHHLRSLRALPGAGALLGTVACAGFYTGVVSNKQGPLLRAEIEHLGWREMISAAIGAGDAARDKPAPEPMTMVLEGSGLEPGADVWYVGDTEIDMVFALAAGCTGVLLRAAAPDEGDFGGAMPALHFASPAELAHELTGKWDNGSTNAKNSLSAQGGI